MYNYDRVFSMMLSLIVIQAPAPLLNICFHPCCWTSRIESKAYFAWMLVLAGGWEAWPLSPLCHGNFRSRSWRGGERWEERGPGGPALRKKRTKRTPNSYEIVGVIKKKRKRRKERKAKLSWLAPLRMNKLLWRTEKPPGFVAAETREKGAGSSAARRWKQRGGEDCVAKEGKVSPWLHRVNSNTPGLGLL